MQVGMSLGCCGSQLAKHSFLVAPVCHCILQHFVFSNAFFNTHSNQFLVSGHIYDGILLFNQ